MTWGFWPSASSDQRSPLARPVAGAEAVIAVDQLVEVRHGARLAARGRGGKPRAQSLSGPLMNAPAAVAQAAQARLDPGQGPGQRGLSRDAPADARAQPRHRVRGGGLPEHRRMLDQEACDGDDPRRHLHPGLRLLQRQDRHAARRSTRSSPSMSRPRRPSSASSISWSPRSTATTCPTAERRSSSR